MGSMRVERLLLKTSSWTSQDLVTEHEGVERRLREDIKGEPQQEGPGFCGLHERNASWMAMCEPGDFSILARRQATV